MNLYLYMGVVSTTLAAEFGTKAALRPGVDVSWGILSVVFSVLATLLIQKGIRQER